jgi:iduronate 2-sulfatase
LRELQETPFFMAVGFWKPHLPFNAPKKYWDMYERSDFEHIRYPDRLEGVPDVAWNNSHEARTYTDVPNSGEISEEKKLELRHGYFAAITYLDAQIGKLLDELDRLGLSQNTVVVFFSDHGFHAGEFGEFGKLTNFEIGTQVPLIIAYPGIPHAGESTNALTELVDIYPTLVDLCGLPSPAGGRQLSGTSLLPVLNDPSATVKTAALSQISRPLGVEQDFGILGSSIRTDTHRYNVWIQRSDGSIVAEELYDLSADPYVVVNAAGDRRLRSLKQQLLNQLYDRLQ